jgi:hypothetical protein
MFGKSTFPRAVALTASAGTLFLSAACGSASSSAADSSDKHSEPTALSTPDMGGMAGMTAMAGGEHHPDPGKGLLSSEDGFTLVPASASLSVGSQTVRFTIVGPDGRPQTSYTPDQTKLLHFYLVRSDLTGYVHDHPTLGPDGVWSITVRTAQPGRYRMYADFIARDSSGKDHPVLLSAALTAPGVASVVPVLAGPTTRTVDGLTVAMVGRITAGVASRVTFAVQSGGKPVTDLQQYLDTFAHLTALRAGDMAYEHVHPELSAAPGQPGGPALPFTVELPEKGTWRLFLQVRRAGALHLIPFTVTAA